MSSTRSALALSRALRAAVLPPFARGAAPAARMRALAPPFAASTHYLRLHRALPAALSPGNHPRRMSTMDAAGMAMVNRTWKIIEQDLTTHGEKFFHNLFELDPSLRKMFAFDSSTGTTMQKHGANVLRMIGNAASLKDDITKIQKTLVALGGRHVEYGVGKELFPIMGQALMMTLKDELGPAWTSEVEEAWEQAYSNVTTYIIQGLELEE
eukprot:CAMPEP_0174916612 /NCGR_PEP_ID=MMETSP1355-20121228/1919_1 /TAXON_ID=464990 /ORGANISM="Hemiselmis tepida, Strain CCMP443" /LENGTH=210 /DNA_ID=CAMNT_0016161623 /DNA_START=26 /DNA_END=655 /DNA_ORIENTATION=+